MSLNTWMICGLALYVCFVIYVGFLGAKKIKGLSDFAVAGESMGPIPLGLAFAASFFSAATFMGYVGFCYAWGSTGMWIFLAIFCASTLGFILLAKGVRNSNVELKSISMADWLAKRYNSDVLRGLCSIVFIIQIFYIAGQPQLLNKIIALKNPKDMSKMIWTWIFASFCCLLVMFGGLYMRAINPSLKVADNAVIEYVKLFHPVISTILSVAIVAALMSTACGLILVITTCISNDLFLKTLVKHGIINMEAEKAERFAYGLTKILPAIIGAISLYLVFNPPPFMGVMVWIGISGVSAATLAPLIFALFLPKIANSKAAIIGAIVGEGVYFYLYLIAHIERSVMAAGAWGVLVSFVVMFVLGSLWKSDLPEAQAQK